ncbi:hypothetical protein PAPYR_10135 [Paratrimastix pyriformis]|uniref:Thioredoxin-like fold domain-containing protein n=1 Tax=Paratrimastix pyriformis TaxID=342808 RepID=A0ABQ8U6M5_9EUKA|nr:hypothetical protein PAPYR_10135 [Paratrimastix pyriformis]
MRLLGWACICLLVPVFAGAPIPKHYDGYRMGSAAAPVQVDVFVDPQCPDSAQVWPVMRQLADASTTMVAHLLPLPYHRSSFLASQAALGVDRVRPGQFFPMMDYLFKSQNQWSDTATASMAYPEVLELFAGFAGKMGVPHDDFIGQMNNSTTNWDTRVSWKFASSAVEEMKAVVAVLLVGLAFALKQKSACNKETCHGETSSQKCKGEDTGFVNGGVWGCDTTDENWDSFGSMGDCFDMKGAEVSTTSTSIDASRKRVKENEENSEDKWDAQAEVGDEFTDADRQGSQVGRRDQCEGAKAKSGACAETSKNARCVKTATPKKTACTASRTTLKTGTC